MSLFVIADLHLSTLDETDKSMEVFGRRWERYTERLEANWRHLISEDDTVVIPGDISWALSLAEARMDLAFLNSLPGKKILGKGNHDFWWCTMKKHQAFFEENGIDSIEFLFNNALETEDFIIAGTRGWFSDEDAMKTTTDADFEKLRARELLRLGASLRAAKQLQSEENPKEILVFTHFPPIWAENTNEEFIDLLQEYGVKRVYYGHIHGQYSIPPSFVYRDILFTIVSADYLQFIPLHIPKM